MSILLVDDSPMQRLALSSILVAEGCADLLQASSVAEAFARLSERESEVDLILMDLQMPDVDGIEGCRRIKADSELRDVPIIMVTGSSETDDLRTAFAVGAMDYITKPPCTVELMARVRSALKLKAEMDGRKAREKDLEREREKSDRLLLNVLPEAIAERLKQGPAVIADSFPEATVLFADIVDFTALSARRAPGEVVELLNEVFSRFDALAARHGLEKIKTIGDAYMVAGGLSAGSEGHCAAVADLALAMRDITERDYAVNDRGLQLRIGIATGPVVAGVVGTKKFIYDLWGDTVNIASRLTSESEPGRIQVDERTFRILSGDYDFEAPRTLNLKGKGYTTVYELLGRADQGEGAQRNDA